MMSFVIKAQELPTNPENGFAFPIGSKFTIKLVPVDSVSFDYSIIKFEPFEEIVNIFDNDRLFSDLGEEDTIEFYFCLGTHGDNDEEREANMNTLLLFKNFTPHVLGYASDIQIQEDGEFEETSNVGCYPGAMGTEMWPYMIYAIGLHDFKVLGE